mgnify:CR=1 FL=1
MNATCLYYLSIRGEGVSMDDDEFREIQSRFNRGLYVIPDVGDLTQEQISTIAVNDFDNALESLGFGEFERERLVWTPRKILVARIMAQENSLRFWKSMVAFAVIHIFVLVFF